MTERLCPRTDLPTRLCECWEVAPMDKPLTHRQREHYKARAERREAKEDVRLGPLSKWRTELRQL